MERSYRSNVVCSAKNGSYEFIESCVRRCRRGESAKIITKDKDCDARCPGARGSHRHDASEAHAQLIDDHEIVQRARTTAETVLRDAEAKALKVREGADAYAAQVLVDLDQRLSTALGSVQKGLATLTAARTPAPVEQPLAEAAAKSKRAAFDAQAVPVAGETAQLESV